MTILFFDVDGTIFSHHSHQIPPSTKQAVLQTQKLGNLCVYNTSRSYSMLKECKSLSITDAIICNGAGIVVEGEPYILHKIDLHKVNDIVYKIMDLNGAFQIYDWQYCYQNETLYKQTADYFYKHYHDYHRREIFHRKGIKPLSRYYGTDVLKIDVFFTSKKQIAALQDILDNSLQIHLKNSSKYNCYCLEITSYPYNKGTGIKEYLELIDEKSAKTYAFGDSKSDEPMFKLCDTSISIGNALQYVDYVSDDIDEGGLAQSFIHYQLI